jgi:hypothetical protein
MSDTAYDMVSNEPTHRDPPINISFEVQEIQERQECQPLTLSPTGEDTDVEASEVIYAPRGRYAPIVQRVSYALFLITMCSFFLTLNLILFFYCYFHNRGG